MARGVFISIGRKVPDTVLNKKVPRTLRGALGRCTATQIRVVPAGRQVRFWVVCFHNSSYFTANSSLSSLTSSSNLSILRL